MIRGPAGRPAGAAARPDLAPAGPRAARRVPDAGQSRPRSTSTMPWRCARVAASAASGSRASTASMIAMCSGSRLAGAAGMEREAELVARRLRAQPLEQLSRGGVVAELADAAVEVLVQPRVLDEVAGPHRILDVCAQPSQLVGIRLGEVLGGLAGAQRLEPDPHLDDLDRLVDADRAHPRAAVGHALHEPLARQVQQRRAHRRARGVVPLAEVGFDQALVRSELAIEDRVLESLGQIEGCCGLVRPRRRAASVMCPSLPVHFRTDYPAGPY